MNFKVYAVLTAAIIISINVNAQSIDTTTRNTGVPNFGRTIMLADSLAGRRIADSSAAAQTITGAKIFQPTVTGASGYAKGLIIQPTFYASANGQYIASLYIPSPNIVNLSSYSSIGVYSAIFAGNVMAPVFWGNLRTNTITRNNAYQAMTLLKPNSNLPHLFTIYNSLDTAEMTSNTALLSSTYFTDSIKFKSNTNAAGYSQVLFRPVLTQTGFTGITRGLYMNPALTDIYGFRGIETNVSGSANWAYYGAGTSPSLFTGKLFIGDTTGSNSQLVVNTVRSGNQMGQVGIGKASAAGAITFVNSDGNGFGTVGYKANSSVGDFLFSSAGGSGNITFSTAGADRMTLTAAGYVGIGTASPQGLLSVNGDIYAKRIKVTSSGWADYVFDSSYQLRSVEALDRFIQLNKHLPELPAAAEVAANGVDLGENHVALLKKIEELTLYIIDQHKCADLQQQQLLEEKAKNEQLEKRLAAIEKMLAGK